MELDEYRRMYELERTYWWHVGRLDLLRSLLDTWLPRKARKDGRLVLDFGCGTGTTLELLSRYGRVVGADESEVALGYCRQGETNSPRVNLVRIPREGRLPFRDGSFDLVTALDVLEHLQDDRSALAELHRILAPGGVLVVFVPAYRFLWSEHDEALHHRRRYIASSLHIRLNRAGFRVLKRTYAIAFSFPLVACYRVVKGLIPSSEEPRTSYVMLPRAVNSLFAWFLKVEAVLVRWMNFPFGTSIAAVAIKEDGR